MYVRMYHYRREQHDLLYKWQVAAGTMAQHVAYAHVPVC